ncbi:UNVERIFIED_CONTAM: hypothetical protein GTU68_037562 [Idotea baltica]|nr:hypothetical protein [Idotea baltica]
MSFATFGLSPEILKALDQHGYDTPTPIQSKAIPQILKGKDVMAAAQTGTGKTAGFVLPILEQLSKSESARANRAKVLVLTPTRELAAQVAESAATYGQHLPLRTVVVYGGVKINPQMMKLRKGADILVATPGRLLDLHNQNAVKFEQLEGDKTQAVRTKTLANFKQGSINILVATDVAARGLDIEQLPQVVNFDLPIVAEDYVHRIGRTGRAGLKGEAVSLVSADEFKQLTEIERLIKRLLPRKLVDGFEPNHNVPESKLDLRPLKPKKPKKPKKTFTNAIPNNARPVKNSRQNSGGKTQTGKRNHKKK